MNLTEEQKQVVAGWVRSGTSLADIQKRLSTEFGLVLRYMEVRFLVDDLKLVPKDPEKPAVPVDILPKETAAPGPATGASPLVGGGRAPQGPPSAPVPVPPPAPAGAIENPADDAEAAMGSGVSISVDQVTRPGALVSGSVKFSDGQTATWYLDRMGRLGMAAAQKGYRPSPQDLEEFQIGLEQELARLGM